MARPRRSWLALATGAAAALAWGAWFGSFERPWTLRGDNALGILPMWAEAFRQWSEGRVPGWTNGQWGGFPLATDSQATSFYPPTLLAFALVPHPHLRALDLATALHFGILAAGSFRLAAELGAGRVAALFAAGLVLLAPQVLWWTSFSTAFAALCWWPWLFLAAERLLRPGRSALRDALLGSLALGAQALAGYVEFAFYGGCIAGLWILCAASPLGVASRLRRAFLLGAAGCLLAAPQLVPTLLELGGTERAAEPDHLTFLALGSGGVRSLFDPRTGAGPAWSSAFLGTATLLLAGRALVRRAPRSLFLAILAALAGLLALGERTPAYALLVSVPPFHLFRAPFKFFVVTQMAVVWLAALGLGGLLAAPARPRRWLGALLALGAFAEYGVHASLQLPQLARPHTPQEARLPEDLEALRSLLPEILAAAPSGGPPPRVLFAQGPGRFGSLGMLLGIESLNGGPVSHLARRHRRLLGDFPAALGRARLDLLGVDFVLVPGACVDPPGGDLELAARRAGLCLLRNPGWPPRYELTSRVERVDTEEEMLERVLRDPGGPIAIAAPPDATLPVPSDVGRDGDVEAIEYRPGRVRLGVAARRPTALLVRESWSRGWRARVDGRPAPIHPAAGLFFAVPLAAGRHTVELRYATPGLGAGVTALAAGAALVVWARMRRRSRWLGRTR
jgi:hypothetical protein